jgi:hypothetical protein
VAVDLEPVTQTWLHHAITALHLEDESLDVGVQIIVDFEKMPRNDRTEQHSPETGRRIGRQHEMTESHAPRRRDGPRVPDLEFCQEHRARR